MSSIGIDQSLERALRRALLTENCDQSKFKYR